MSEWYEQAFGDFYLQLYAHRDADEARRVLDLVFAPGDLEGRRVLDLACGAGRYLPEIERRGGIALGLDLSMPLLREARRTMPAARIACADMRRVPLPESSVDWVLSLFTSFGYFEEVDEHRELLRDWAGLTREGLVLDVPNPAQLRSNLVPHSERIREEYRVEEARRLETSPARVVKELKVRDASGAVVLQYEERVLLFEPIELEDMLAEVGLSVERRWGDYGGSPFDAEDSPRQVLRCRRTGGSA